MSLNRSAFKTTLKASFKALFDLTSANGSQEAKTKIKQIVENPDLTDVQKQSEITSYMAEKWADKIATDIDAYIKTATVRSAITGKSNTVTISGTFPVVDDEVTISGSFNVSPDTGNGVSNEIL